MLTQEEGLDALLCQAALNAPVNQDSLNKVLQTPFQFDRTTHKVEFLLLEEEVSSWCSFDSASQ